VLPWAPPGRPGAGAGSKRSLGQPQPLEQAILPGAEGEPRGGKALLVIGQAALRGGQPPPRPHGREGNRARADAWNLRAKVEESTLQS